MDRFTEDRNYHSDHRVRAGNRSCWWTEINEKRMTVVLDEGFEIEGEIPIKFIVCETCKGKGTHVNPSIDSGGLTAEDFAEDPDFLNEYIGSRYDVPCYECGGKRVVPWPVHANHQILVQQWLNEEADYQRECEAERRMGA